MTNSSTAAAGDYVSIKTASEEIKGIILESYEKGIILVKLDSGYNIGLAQENIKSVRLLKKSDRKQEAREIKQEKSLPAVAMIVTGGTISSKLDYSTGGVKWLSKPEELFDSAPEISKIV